MKILIVGCGKLGSALAIELYNKGNEITVIDSNEDSFYRLGVDFNGNTIVGVGYDRDVLEEAGIPYQDAVIASTDKDEVNVLVGKIAKDIYMVPHVIARLYDPHRAKIFQTLGIKTISTTGFGVERAIELLSYGKMDSIIEMGESDNVEVVRIVATPSVEGAFAKELTDESKYRLISIVRGKDSFLPTPEEIIKTDDILYFSVVTKYKKDLKTLLGL